MLEVMGYITMGAIWFYITFVVGTMIGRGLKRQDKVPIKKFKVPFQWRLSPHHNLRETVICVNGEIVWRGSGTQALVKMPMGISEVLMYYIDKDKTITKETLDFSLSAEGVFRYHTRDLSIYPEKALA